VSSKETEVSYSLPQLHAASKDELIAKVSEAFDEQVLKQQPVHKIDKQTHLANFAHELSLLPPLPAGCEYTGSMSGYLSWERPSLADQGEILPEYITGGGFGCSVGIRRIGIVS
jgi:hypothetical protein